ncbi:MAG: type II secretion system F family protein, partial [Planctomycetales bacterium]|nr:type II secretion system F family protein [Planctomycetales bacterium]
LFAKRGYSSHATTMVRELATLLSVGVPVVESLEIIANQHSGHFRTALFHLKDRIAGGESLAEAMAAQPNIFDDLTVRMVEVGENAGNLEDVLEQVADFKERSLQLKDKVMNALLYPLVVMCVSLAVCLFLMTIVVPMLLQNLLDAGRELPWPTRVLQTTSDLLLAHGFALAIVIGVIIAGFLAVLRTKRGKRSWHALLLKFPLVGTMIKRQTISRLAMVISTLLRSGIVYLTAVEIGAKCCKNVVFRQAVLDSSDEVRAGREIGPALENTGLFPAMVVQIFAIGQESGQLEEMLDRLAENYDRQVSTLSTRFASILEPCLILILAVFVGFILFATILPILEAGNVL